jgi:excisionase family DNA binding protein
MSESSPWLNVREASKYARCCPRILYSAVASGRLRAARLADRKKLLFRREWLDQFIEASTIPQEIAK